MPGYPDPTAIQQRVLAFITEAIRTRGRPPTNQEITDHFGWKSTNAARGHVRLLIRKGLLVKDSGLARGISLPADARPAGRTTLHEVPVVGQVAAGVPAYAEQNCDGLVGLDASMFPEDDIFALRIKGQSMVNAGIHEGDIALVRQYREPSNGDIVVARVGNDDATVKRFFRRQDHIVLRAENPDFADILVHPGVDFQVDGVVVGVIRRLS